MISVGVGSPGSMAEHIGAPKEERSDVVGGARSNERTESFLFLRGMDESRGVVVLYDQTRRDLAENGLGQLRRAGKDPQETAAWVADDGVRIVRR